MVITDPDDVSVVELVLEGNDLPHEAEGPQLEEGVPGLDQHQDPPNNTQYRQNNGWGSGSPDPYHFPGSVSEVSIDTNTDLDPTKTIEYRKYGKSQQRKEIKFCIYRYLITMIIY